MTGESSGECPGSYRASVWPRLYVIIAFAAMYLAVAANVAIEANHEPESRALIVHEVGDLAKATATDSSMSRGRYWIASTVHDAAFAGVLIVPDRSLVNRTASRTWQMSRLRLKATTLSSQPRVWDHFTVCPPCRDWATPRDSSTSSFSVASGAPKELRYLCSVSGDSATCSAS
jgi:hypothetical protein